MIKLLFTSLSGFPKEESGGPNKVISILTKRLSIENFQSQFISKHGQIILTSPSRKNIMKRVDLFREYFFSKNYFYRKIFSSSIYLNYFLKKSIDIVNQYIQETDYDILNAHDVRTLFKLKSSKKIILSVHSKGCIVNDMITLYGYRKNLSKIYSEFNILEKETLSTVNKIIFPSKAARDMYFDDLGINSNNISTKIIYTGLDVDRINSLYPDDKFYKRFPLLKSKGMKILNVANHIKVKNIDKILLVLSEFRKINKKFIFINLGSGPLTKMLKSIVNDLNLSANVIFIPFLKNEDVIRLMKCCDVYISFSERVIFDIVILEALGCGMKVIAYDAGGNKEVIDNNLNGYLVDINDTENIICLLKKDDDNIYNLARQTIKKFSVEKMVKDYENIFLNVIN